MKIIPIILAGGSGTRLWPLSRQLTPKQLINLSGEGSLLQQTIDRAYLLSEQSPIILTNKQIFDQIDKSRIENKVDYLLEPSAKNTAPAIALAAKRGLEIDPEALLVVLSADHYIDDTTFLPFFQKAMKVAAETESIILIGIKPTRPETGYGYIKTGKKTDEGVFSLASFNEKPDKETAESYIKDTAYLWNAGIFVSKAKVLKAEIVKHIPALAGIFTEAVPENIFSKIEPLSIDFGLLEKTKNIAVVPADATWNDLGSWGSIYDVSPLDKDGNYFEGNVVSETTSGSLIMSRGNRRIATIGLKDVVIVDTEDVTLICDRDQSQDVKKIVDRIKLEPDNRDYIEHKTMHRPWGKYTVLDEGEGFKVKFIHVQPGQKLSLQKHNHRSEHWVVVKGTAIVTVGDKETTLNQNESTYVPVNTLHRLENIGKGELTIVEVASGDYIDESDIVRIDDIYKRV